MSRSSVLSIPYADRPRQFDTQIINIGVSSSALFDTRNSDKIFREKGEKEYMAYMAARAKVPFKPGAAFPFVKKMISLNRSDDVVVNPTLLSRNNPFAARRVDASIKAHGLTYEDNGLRQIYGEAYTGGGPITPEMLKAFGVDLFLSTKIDDVKSALMAGCAAGLVSTIPCALPKVANDNSICFVFDFDRVLGIAYGRPDDEYPYDSERNFRDNGLRAYHMRETALADVPAEPGPLAPFFLKVVNLRDCLSQRKGTQIEMHIVTARAAGSLMRVITTLDAWRCETKGLISCGSTPKAPQLENLKADIFFDDSERHLANLPPGTLGALIPWIEQAPRRPKTRNNAVKGNNLNPQTLRKVIG